MKFTRSTWISVFVTLFLVAAVVLYQMYTGAKNDHELAQSNLKEVQLSQTVLNTQKLALAAQMAQAAADVAAWNSKITLLQTQLGQASLSLTQTQSQFPLSVQTIEYSETLMGLARSSNLTMNLLVATEPAKGDLSVSDFTFYTNVFTISVRGKVSDILNFVDKIATNVIFQTGAMTPVSFNIPLPPQPPQIPPSPQPQPVDQAIIDQMRADIKAKMIADVDASTQGADRVALIEQALLTLLGEGSTGPTVAQMTQMIHDIITTQFSSSVADQLSNDIALAIENNLADSLISTVATIYSNAIAALFTTGNIADLLPVFTGPLGPEIMTAIQDATKDAMPGIINTIITDKLNLMVSDEIAAMVSDAEIDAALQVAVDAVQAADYQAAMADWEVQAAILNLEYQTALAAAVPSAQLTIAVYSYKGD